MAQNTIRTRSAGDAPSSRAGAARRLRRKALAEQTCRLVFQVSASMVGVCLTGVGLVHVAAAVSRTGTAADDLLSADALLFLVATICSYLASRVESDERLHRLERVADVAFILAIVLLTAACFMITYTLRL